MTKLVFTDEWFEGYQRRTGLGEHGKKRGNPSDSPSASQHKRGKKAVQKPGTANQKPEEADQKPKKRSKYGNRRTEYGGRVFDSAHEADVFRQLDLRVRAGDLRGVICQQAFQLPGGVKYILRISWR